MEVYLVAILLQKVGLLEDSLEVLLDLMISLVEHPQSDELLLSDVAQTTDESEQLVLVVVVVVVRKQNMPDDLVEVGEVEVGQDDVVAAFSHLAEGLNCQILQFLLDDLEVQDVDEVLGQAGNVPHHLVRQLYHQGLENLQDVPRDAVHLGRVELD